MLNLLGRQEVSVGIDNRESDTMKRMLPLALVLLLAVLVFANACGSSTTDTAATTIESTGNTSDGSTGTTMAGAAGVIKIGHIRPLSGPLAMASQEMIKGFNFALEQAGYQVAGKTVEVIEGDSKGDAATAVDVARRMVERDGVAMIVGPTQGAEEMAVASYCEQVGVPVMFTNPAPFGVIAQNFQWTISSQGTEPMPASCMGAYAYDELGLRQVNVLSGDFAPGHGFMDAFMKTFKSKGGTVVQETYTPYPSPDFAPYLAALKDADAVVSWIDGEQAIKLLTQYHQLGIDKKMPIVGAFHGSFFSPYILRMLPPEVAEAYVGSLTPVPYSSMLDTEVNRQFVADFQAKFGYLPDDPNTGSYQGAQIILAALEATNGDTTPEMLRAAIVAVEFEGVDGPVKFNAQTGCVIKTYYIAKIAKQGENFVYEPIMTYSDVPPAGF